MPEDFPEDDFFKMRWHDLNFRAQFLLEKKNPSKGDSTAALEGFARALAAAEIQGNNREMLTEKHAIYQKLTNADGELYSEKGKIAFQKAVEASSLHKSEKQWLCDQL